VSGRLAFQRLVDHVMRQAPYHEARRVFWIMDNGSSHRREAAVKRLTQAYPRLVPVHGPVHLGPALRCQLLQLFEAAGGLDLEAGQGLLYGIRIPTGNLDPIEIALVATFAGLVGNDLHSSMGGSAREMARAIVHSDD